MKRRTIKIGDVLCLCNGECSIVKSYYKLGPGPYGDMVELELSDGDGWWVNVYMLAAILFAVVGSVA